MGNKRVCVSIGTNDVNSLQNMVKESFDNNADFIEIRFDFFPKSSVNDVLAVVLDHRDQAVFTCRATNEGGKYSGEEQERIATLRRLAAFRPMLLDVEYNTMVANEYLQDQFNALNCDILLSWHNFELTPAYDELVNRVDRMKEYGNNVKVVCMARSIDDSISMLQLYEHARASNVNLIAFCMGEHGILSRVLCTYAGAKFTYASLADAVAPGQLTLKQMRTVYEKLSANAEFNEYNSWKGRRDFNDVLKIINECKGQ